MSGDGSKTPVLRHAVKTAQRPGLTRDLVYGPEDLQWVANSATLVYGTVDAVLVDTFTSIGQNAELVEWVKSFGRKLTYIYITHGHGDHFFGIKQMVEGFPTARAVGTLGTVAAADGQGEPAILSETAAYLRDFNRLEATSSTPEDLYAGMLELYPRRANPGSLWGGAKHAKSASPVG
jgi:glyoxylase-like metal-dependent hydrolase (beta-lactamase superfamily II)